MQSYGLCQCVEATGGRWLDLKRESVETRRTRKSQERSRTTFRAKGGVRKYLCAYRTQKVQYENHQPLANTLLIGVARVGQWRRKQVRFPSRRRQTAGRECFHFRNSCIVMSE